MTQEEGLTGDEYREMTEKQDETFEHKEGCTYKKGICTCINHQETCQNCGHDIRSHIPYCVDCDVPYCKKFVAKYPYFKNVKTGEIVYPKNHSRQEKNFSKRKFSYHFAPAGTHSPQEVITSGKKALNETSIQEDKPFEEPKVEVSEGNFNLSDERKELRERLIANKPVSINLIFQYIKTQDKKFISLLKKMNKEGYIIRDKDIDKLAGETLK